MSEVKLKPTGGGAGSISLKAPSATTGNADFPLVLPADDGSADQYLKTNGSGALSWATVSAAALTGSTNNTVCTVTGANAIAGEANLTFDGTDLAISRDANSAGGISITNTNNAQGSQIAQLALSGGDNAYANISLECNGNTHHIKQDGSGNLDFINGSTKRWRIRSNGHLESNDTNLALLRSGTTGDSDILFGDSADDDIGRIRYDHDDDSLQFLVNAAERLRIQSGGDVEVKTGNLVIGTSGKGIDFSNQGTTGATGATMVDELLDHYEQGTWTPTISYDSGSGDFVGNVASASGNYIRIGDLVWISGTVTLTTARTSFNSHLSFSQIPFNARHSSAGGIMRGSGNISPLNYPGSFRTWKCHPGYTSFDVSVYWTGESCTGFEFGGTYMT